MGTVFSVAFIYDRKCVLQLLGLLETLLILIRKRVGVWMDLRTEKIGGGLPRTVIVAVAGVKRKEKLAYLVAEEIAGRQNAVLTISLSEKQVRVEHCLPLIGGMMVVILDMKHGVIANGHLDGVLKTKIRTPELRRRQIWRRKMLTMTINLLQVVTVQLLSVTQILAINGGHDIEWRFILVVQMPTVLHLDLDLREDGWRVQTWDLPLDVEGQMLLGEVYLQAPLVLLILTRVKVFLEDLAALLILFATQGESFLTYIGGRSLVHRLLPCQMRWRNCPPLVKLALLNHWLLLPLMRKRR
jgi:hypothetical protein